MAVWPSREEGETSHAKWRLLFFYIFDDNGAMEPYYINIDRAIRKFFVLGNCSGSSPR